MTINEEISTRRIIQCKTDFSESRMSLKCQHSDKLSTAREEEAHGCKNSTGNKYLPCPSGEVNMAEAALVKKNYLKSDLLNYPIYLNLRTGRSDV